MKQYQTSHSEKTVAKPEAVWALWADIENWPAWDVGLEACSIDGEPETGKTFILTPKGAPAPVNVTIREIEPNVHLIDETRLPFGKIKASHVLSDDAGDVVITHTIEAEIDHAHTELFEQQIWSNMEAGVAQSVKNLVVLAERQT